MTVGPAVQDARSSRPTYDQYMEVRESSFR